MDACGQRGDTGQKMSMLKNVSIELMLCAIQRQTARSSWFKGDNAGAQPYASSPAVGSSCRCAVFSVAQRGLLFWRGGVRRRLLVDDAGRRSDVSE